MERGLKIPQSERTKTTNALLVSLMNQLEKDKNSLKLGPDDHLHVEGFALNVFAKADKQDRAGRADLFENFLDLFSYSYLVIFFLWNAAKTFYAASIFFEILNQFGEVQLDLEQKHKYAVWKAADIRKALKEGRKPLPGPPGGDKDLSGLSTSSPKIHPQPNYSSDNFHQPPSTNKSDHSTYHQSYHQQPYQQEPQQNLPQHYTHQQQYQQEPQKHFPQHCTSQDVPSFSYPNIQSYPSFTESTLPTAPSQYPSYYQGSDASYANTSPSTTPAYPSNAQYNSNARNGSVVEASVPTTQKYEYDSSYQPPPEKIAEAHKAARFAVGALAFDDVSIAVDHLNKSLELLTNPSAGN
ncbi:hypothetical protein RD792_002527 [Penstemon davidsonii]|uniref:Uncharacterized protein n=1 Tax=Penstemon davidsonii TaxID=160366 RepID=A0ABR0DRJ9_9LAMI|nr:hypothetical protein RD792_002527 [Penstemon davidsonii]